MSAKTGYLHAIQHYQQVRNQTEAICNVLELEDYVIQGMDDVSPPKWHLAHTTWFFESLLLIPFVKNYKMFDQLFLTLFNSYYQQINEPYPRSKRGLLSRPTVKQIYAYRHAIDQQLLDFLTHCTLKQFEDAKPILDIGLQHEQQHQELLCMDIKYNYFLNPDYPIYNIQFTPKPHSSQLSIIQFQPYTGGTIDIGHQGDGFHYDHEAPAHHYFLAPFAIADRLVVNQDYLQFIDDGGYTKPEYWLAEGWDCITKHQWQAPLYWQRVDDQWYVFSLNGLQKLNPYEPVCHVSFFEADAFARWAGKRLPSEFEWEHAVKMNQLNTDSGNFLENHYFHPQVSYAENQSKQFFGDVWEWTSSPFIAYPGYKAYSGILNEYNSKFMCNQHVLRGGSCVTPKSHIRTTYRNFFQAEKRWQFSGIRLAETNG